MTLDPADIATLLAMVVVGPWGVVLAIALVRGYSITLRIRRPRRPPPEDGTPQSKGSDGGVPRVTHGEDR